MKKHLNFCLVMIAASISQSSSVRCREMFKTIAPVLLLALATCSQGRKFGSREEFFKELILRYRLPQTEAAIWNCLADHHSNFDSGLKQRALNAAESNYGVLQINGNIWCSDGQNLCGIQCQQLLDDDLSDDILCARRIYQLQGLSAWDAWERRCLNRLDEYQPQYKREERCDFARDLFFQQHVPASMLATMVCLAEEESGFNVHTQAGPNEGGYKTHGLFRISDQWWCSDEGGVAQSKQLCRMPCAALLDNDITDDIRCVMTIFNETASYREDKDGWYAWDSYAKRCFDQQKNQAVIRDCFTTREFSGIFTKITVTTAAPNRRHLHTTVRLPPWITQRVPTRPPTIFQQPLRQELVVREQKKIQPCWNLKYPEWQVLGLDVEDKCFLE